MLLINKKSLVVVSKNEEAEVLAHNMQKLGELLINKFPRLDCIKSVYENDRPYKTGYVNLNVTTLPMSLALLTLDDLLNTNNLYEDFDEVRIHTLKSNRGFAVYTSRTVEGEKVEMWYTLTTCKKKFIMFLQP